MKKFVIIGAKWFDSINGNTYHNAKIIDPTLNKIDKYTVDEIYGLCGSCFKDCIKIIDSI